MSTPKNIVVTEAIPARILTIRGQRVLIDADLAELYGVSTKVLNQAVKRNQVRFPADFMFQLLPEEKIEVVTNCDHLAKLKFSKSLPFAFTEHGAIQAANVLNSPQAVDMGISDALAKQEISQRLGQKAISGPLNKVIRELLAQGLIEMTRPETPNSRLQKYRRRAGP